MKKLIRIAQKKKKKKKKDTKDVVHKELYKIYYKTSINIYIYIYSIEGN